MNIKKISYPESYGRIREWLDKGNSLKRLDNYQNFVNYRIDYALKDAIRKPQIGPMSFYKIKTNDKYRKLYLILDNDNRKNGIMNMMMFRNFACFYNKKIIRRVRSR